MSDPVISVENVSKAYRIWENPSARLTAPLLETTAAALRGVPARWLKDKAAKSYRDFWALKDVSFELRRGESIGIIGRNGSGKSTLLQIIAGTLQPTEGTVKVNGRVAALLELGSGFNPEFTGRENVHLNGAVLGLSRSEVEAKFAEVTAFADIGDFIDQPVKTYSSGMMIRLAFAVAVTVEPDILIVDEALSVGDVFFQQKCFKRVREMLSSGVSLLFVSHDTGAVQNLCDRAILLGQGKPIFSGPPEEAVSRYFAFAGPASQLKSNRIGHRVSDQRDDLRALLAASDLRSSAKSEHGAKDLLVRQVGFFDQHGRPAHDFRVGGKIRIVAAIQAIREICDPNTGLHLYDRMNNLVFAAGTRQLRQDFSDFAANEERIVEFVLELSVQPGVYTLSIGCGQASDDANAGYVQHRLEGLGPINVIPADEGTWSFYGMAKLPLQIAIHG